MPRVLTSVLTFHWAAAFAVLGMACVMGGESGASRALALLGLAQTGLIEYGAPVMVLIALCSALCSAICSLLFSWAFVASVFSDPESDGDVAQMAFASAALVVSFLAICGSVNSVAGLYPVAAAHLAALLTSYLAIQAERLTVIMSASPEEGDIRAAARIMALGAAHSSMLSRLSGRPAATFGEGR